MVVQIINNFLRFNYDLKQKRGSKNPLSIYVLLLIYLYKVLFTAFTMRSTFGKASSIKDGENANGVSV
jgi:hypothetical protein